jgi:hypothetical protein
MVVNVDANKGLLANLNQAILFLSNTYTAGNHRGHLNEQYGPLIHNSTEFPESIPVVACVIRHRLSYHNILVEWETFRSIRSRMIFYCRHQFFYCRQKWITIRYC